MLLISGSKLTSLSQNKLQPNYSSKVSHHFNMRMTGLSYAAYNRQQTEKSIPEQASAKLQQQSESPF